MPSLPGDRQRPDPIELFRAASVVLPISGTPLLEPSRRRHRKPPDVRKKIDGNDHDAENQSEMSPWKEPTSSRRGQITVRRSSLRSFVGRHAWRHIPNNRREHGG
jgi:hypothetical protein